MVEADAWEAADWSDEQARWPRDAAHPAGLADRRVYFVRGHAALRALSPGGYRFKVFGAAIAIDPESIDVAPGLNPEIELRWHETTK